MSSPPSSASRAVEVSVVIPCLNEEKTVGGCVREALEAFAAHNLSGEVIVADNNSGDRSRECAREAGATVVPVTNRGYGYALMAGIAAARAPYVIMGDADGSYNFGDAPKFVEKLRAGCDLVQGCRLPGGGGSIAKGAMPWSHRWIGNPALTLIARVMFRTRINDVYCGLRGFSKAFYARIDQRCTGMEFAAEMIVKSALYNAKVSEVPITLRRDGREGRGSHLRTFRDGWRTLRIFLLYSPRWLHLGPSIVLMVLGTMIATLALAEARIGPATLGAHSLLVGALLVLIGYQGLFLSLFAMTFAWREKLTPEPRLLARFYRAFRLEHGILFSLGVAGLGICLIGALAWEWREKGFSTLPYAETMRTAVLGALSISLAAQTFFGSFVISLTSLDRKP